MAKTKVISVANQKGGVGYEKHQCVLHRRRTGHGRQESSDDGC
ncbi:MAG: AAA family ATPase [Blautia glucerasea]|nr:AAA family ATPase [Blautia glucerasea]MDY3087497.1 hypothetical protein [Blautia sp.]